MEFVMACRQHGIKPGLYIAAGCDAYHHCGPHPAQSAEEYKALQNGMVAELVGGKYGVIEYLWFDHHGNPVNSTSPFGPWVSRLVFSCTRRLQHKRFFRAQTILQSTNDSSR